MGMDLARLEDGEKFTCSNGMWGIILQSAEKGGWKPCETFKMDENENPEKNWDKNDYTTQKGQIVSETDAFEMSKALKKFIKDKKDEIDTNEFYSINQFIEWLKAEDYIGDGIDYFPGFEIY